MKCKCNGKLQMVKVSHIEEIYNYKDKCFHQYDCDGYEEIYFKCEECGTKYEINMDGYDITSVKVEKLYIQNLNHFATNSESELNIKDLRLKRKNNLQI